MSRPRLLDLFCCEGGAAMGYYRSGFDVVGVDVEPQPNYPFPIVVQMLEASGVPYVIGNVEAAPLRPDVVLCGSMFDLQVRRHRVFELGRWFVWGAPRCHHWAQRRRGRIVDVTGHPGGRNQTLRDGYPIKFYDGHHAREVMGMPWASIRGCVEAVPPAYTEWLGGQLIAHVGAGVSVTEDPPNSCDTPEHESHLKVESGQEATRPASALHALPASTGDRSSRGR